MYFTRSIKRRIQRNFVRINSLNVKFLRETRQTGQPTRGAYKAFLARHINRFDMGALFIAHRYLRDFSKSLRFMAADMNINKEKLDALHPQFQLMNVSVFAEAEETNGLVCKPVDSVGVATPTVVMVKHRMGTAQTAREVH